MVQEVNRATVAVLQQILEVTECTNFVSDGFQAREQCAATANSGDRCRISPSRRHDAWTLFTELSTMCVQTDCHSFYAKVNDFLAAACCKRVHVTIVIGRFEEWKTKTRRLNSAMPSSPAAASQAGRGLARKDTDTGTHADTDTGLRMATPEIDTLGNGLDGLRLTSVSRSGKETPTKTRAAQLPGSSRRSSNSPRRPTPDPEGLDDNTPNGTPTKGANGRRKPPRASDSGGSIWFIPSVGTLTRKKVDSDLDPSYFDRLMHKPLTGDSALIGRVYVLQHHDDHQLHKVGFTKNTAAVRLSQGSCYSKKVNIVHQSEGEAFLGAERAEKLAHRLLRRRNMVVTDCVECNNGHTEWFFADEDEVVQAVTDMETFLRLPAYVHRQSSNSFELDPTSLEFLKGVESYPPNRQKQSPARARATRAVTQAEGGADLDDAGVALWRILTAHLIKANGTSWGQYR